MFSNSKLHKRDSLQTPFKRITHTLLKNCIFQKLEQLTILYLF